MNKLTAHLKGMDQSQLQNAPILFGLVTIIALMILPVPTFMLDMLLAVNITLSVLIMLTSIYIMRPLEFSGLPAMLLMTTLFRLGLNVASTRLILLGAAEGKVEVGNIIETFGNFVVGGNSIVGVIVFMVLVIINFMVITKGAGRIAEVAARFTLDALPGKQMAVDAELAAGALTEAQAKKRRTEVQREADFYGAMDGASKFVRGDAIAGLIITGINIVGGLLVGVTQGGMSFGGAFQTYTLLTVGDGLVSQIPSLLISTATGVVITRVASESNFGSDIGTQIVGNYRVLYAAAAIVFGLGLVPGMPIVIFTFMAALMGGLGYQLSQRLDPKDDEPSVEKPKSAERSETEVLKDLLNVEPVALEIGYGLLNLVDEGAGGTLLNRLVQMRRQFAQTLGILVPPIHIRDNLELEAGQYRLMLRGVSIGTGRLMPGRMLAIDPGGVVGKVNGVPTKDPTFGLDALWIEGTEQHRAEAFGYTVVNLETVVVTHLTELLRQNASDLFGWPDLSERLDDVRTAAPKLVEDVLDKFGMSGLMSIFRRLLDEHISIRDMHTVLEALAGFKGDKANGAALTQEVRATLARQISNQFMNDEGVIHAALLDRALEENLRRCLVNQNGEPVLACDLGTAQSLFSEIESAFGAFAAHDAEPLILAPPDLRSPLRDFLSQFFPNVDVICHREIVPNAQIVSVAQLGGHDAIAAAE
ncbi:MAG: flagellar biosynthesis protein FlhA [bacterium]